MSLENPEINKTESPIQPKADPESVLEFGEILDNKEQEGYWGISRVEFKDGSLGLFRPDGTQDFIFEAKGLEILRSDLESLAFEIDKILEFGLVPPTVQRSVDSRPGSLQKFISDATIAKKLGKHWAEAVKPEQITRAALFDYLLDAKDRRNDNFLVNEKIGKIWLIDHDYFAFWNEIQNSVILDYALEQGLGQIVSHDANALERFIGQVDGLAAAVKKKPLVEILTKARNRANIVLEERQIPI